MASLFISNLIASLVGTNLNILSNPNVFTNSLKAFSDTLVSTINPSSDTLLYLFRNIAPPHLWAILLRTSLPD